MSKISIRFFLIIIIFSPLLCFADLSRPVFSVSTVEYEWKDSGRDAEIPVKIYYPEKSCLGARPVIIFSHGLGGSREGYEYLGKYWASCGYISVHLQHVGSDTGAILSGMRRAASPENSQARVGDVKFALDNLPVLNDTDGPLKGKLDLGKIGMGGHSFGALTTQILIGQLYNMGKSGRDPRIKAAVIMSPTLITNKFADYGKMFAAVETPSFHMTGTDDTSPLSRTTSAAERRIPYDNILGADKYLMIFKGGDHMVFSGRGKHRIGRDNEEAFHELICEGSTAFWDAYLKGDSMAKNWFSGGDFATKLGANGTFEKSLK